MSVEYQNQIIQQSEFQHSSVEDNNTLFLPSSQLTASPLSDPYMFEGGVLSQEEVCYYYYNNHLTPEEQTLLAVNYNNNNNNTTELYPENPIITWSSELELHDHNYIMNGHHPYLYNDIVENDNFDTYNPFVGQSSMYNDGNLLLTQPLSEVTQNVIENQQFHPYDWCDLSSFPDTQQQYMVENNHHHYNNHNNNNHNNNHNNHNNHNHNNHNINNISSKITPPENCYTAWTDFQLM